MTEQAFSIDTSDLRAAVAGLEDAEAIEAKVVDAALDELGTDILANVRAAGRRHRRTGRMDAAMHVESANRGLQSVVTVVTGPPANLIVGGTREHDIRPLHGGALSMMGARQPFASIVHHPGTRPDPFVAEGIRRSAPDVQKTLDRAGATIVDRLAGAMGGE